MQGYKNLNSTAETIRSNVPFKRISQQKVQSENLTSSQHRVTCWQFSESTDCGFVFSPRYSSCGERGCTQQSIQVRQVFRLINLYLTCQCNRDNISDQDLLRYHSEILRRKGKDYTFHFSTPSKWCQPGQRTVSKKGRFSAESQRKGTLHSDAHSWDVWTARSSTISITVSWKNK